MTHAPQLKIPAIYMRGGTSKGTFFKLDDLPAASLRTILKLHHLDVQPIHLGLLGRGVFGGGKFRSRQ